LTLRIALSTLCLNSGDLTEPTTVTLPLSTNVLTSNAASTGSDASAFSMLDWIVASSGNVDVSPPPSEGAMGVGDCIDDAGVVVGEDFGDGERPGPAGTTCCGAPLAFIGS